MDHAPILVITGQLAAGKSTLARAVLERFEHGVHVDVDGIRELVVSGRASPLAWDAETTRQFELAIAASVGLAAVYARAGFAVAIEGGIDPEVVDRHLAATGLRAVRISLEPPVEVALARNRERTTKSHDPALLEDAILAIDADLATSPLPDGWVRIDNGGESLDATVDRVAALLR